MPDNDPARRSTYPVLGPTGRRAQVYRSLVHTLGLARPSPGAPAPEGRLLRMAEAPPLPADLRPEGVGISLSGGGIRAAAYSLGVLQSLEAHDLLRSASYLSAVSGGSYTATAVTMVALGKKYAPTAERGSPPDPATDVDWLPGSPSRADGRPFFEGTPEEQYLRNRTLYLTHGPGGVYGVAWRVLVGILLNVTILAAALNTVARPLGWLYGWKIPSLRVACSRQVVTCTHYAIPTWAILAVLATAGLSLLLGFISLAWRFRDERRRGFFGALSGGLIVLACLGAIFLIGLPELLYWMALVFHTRPGAGSTPTVTSTTTKSLAGAGAAAFLAAAYGFVSKLITAPSDAEKKVVSWLKPYRKLVINVLAFLAGPVLTIAGAVLLVHWASGHPPGTPGAGVLSELLWWAVPTGLLVVFWWRADIVAWSLHGFYKMRLSAAFALCRTDASGPSPTAVHGEDAQPRPYAHWYPLSDCAPEKPFPEVLICASANVSNYGMTPAEANVTSFVFGTSEIGGPLIGGMATEDYEHALEDYSANPITLPMAMAISGAAFSPSMGRMTRAQWRYLMAVANLRLGVWIPNPRRVHDSLVKRFRSLFPLRPRPHYFVREMLGINDIDAPFIYVTDGGHYDNLGLVELLRRRCKWIWCVDASGDAIDTFSTLGGAIDLARSELQIDIDIDPTEMAPDAASGPRFVPVAHCKGIIHYPGTQTTGTLIVVKAGVTKDAPWDVRAFHAANADFPCDPTFDQLYSASRFDAYRTLGWSSMEQAWTSYEVDFNAAGP